MFWNQNTTHQTTEKCFGIKTQHIQQLRNILESQHTKRMRNVSESEHNTTKPEKFLESEHNTSNN